MSAVRKRERHVEELEAGDRLSPEEFMRRYEAMPHLKKAELIGGIVYVPSPLSTDHGDADIDLSAWLSIYAMNTPGCKAGRQFHLVHSSRRTATGPAPATSTRIRRPQPKEGAVS